jgi:hypothetical protein
VYRLGDAGLTFQCNVLFLVGPTSSVDRVPNRVHIKPLDPLGSQPVACIDLTRAGCELTLSLADDNKGTQLSCMYLKSVSLSLLSVP